MDYLAHEIVHVVAAGGFSVAHNGTTNLYTGDVVTKAEFAIRGNRMVGIHLWTAAGSAHSFWTTNIELRRHPKGWRIEVKGYRPGTRSGEPPVCLFELEPFNLEALDRLETLRRRQLKLQDETDCMRLEGQLRSQLERLGVGVRVEAGRIMLVKDDAEVPITFEAGDINQDLKVFVGDVRIA